MDPLPTRFADHEVHEDEYAIRAQEIAGKLKRMSNPMGPGYLKLMASGQLLNVIWPRLRETDRRFRSIEILDDRKGREFFGIDRRGADAVINPYPLPNNTIPFGQFYGVRILWGKHTPQEPVVRIRLARTGAFGVDTNTDALKIRNGLNVTHYQLTGCVIPTTGRAKTDLSGSARWITSIPTHSVLTILQQHDDLVGHLEAGVKTRLSKADLHERLKLHSGYADLGDGISIVGASGVIWLDIRNGIEVVAA